MRPPLTALLTALVTVAAVDLTEVAPAAASSSSAATTAAEEGATPSPTTPVGVGRLDVAPLQAIVDEAAQDDVRLSVGVQSLGGATLTDGPVVVGSTEPFSSASLIKVALVVAALRAVDEGDLALDQVVEVTNRDDVPGTGVIAGYSSPYSATVAELAELSITVSDNTASNVLAETVGLDAVDRLVADLDLEPTHMGRLFFSDGPAGESNDLDTASTVELLRAVHEGEVLSAASRDLLLGWMRDQQLDTKFAPVLEGVPLASKTGDTSEVSHDGAYLLEEGRETVLVVLSETEDGRSPTAAADPYLADVAEEVAAQVAAAPPAPPVTTAVEDRAVGDAVRTALEEPVEESGSALPAVGAALLGVLAALALAVVALRARVLLRRRRRARR
ncbi:serine hydrolase [Pseudokineococcus marinus]|uniref:Serine hydrolase n=1 Tax=Pseudokineococcus marinus TaxID=351215 RepID=A0A849BN82_9ACTN|nr:serine hydrolase [Pseudokineococcus marinus]NNH22855.1 serine hydrolase [Pseudokineococcus marinus]